MEVNNIGHQWLTRLNMDSSPDADKIFALAALELHMDRNIGIDTYLLVWEGNTAGEEAIVRGLRRCIFHGAPSSRDLLLPYPGRGKTIQQFLEEVQYEENP